MGFGALRSIIRPVARAVSSSPTRTAFTSHSPLAGFLLPPLHFAGICRPPPPPSTASLILATPNAASAFNLAVNAPQLTPPAPYRWVKPVAPELAPPKTPNKGSVKRRNEKKRLQQKKAFIMSEKRKRKAEMQEAKRKKLAKRVERKMAAVARDRAWAERLQELQRLEEEKKKGAIA